MKTWLSVLFLLSAIPAFTQTDVFRTKEYNLDDGVAIKGYDPVAYFTIHKAVRGKKDFSYTYQGVTYHFATLADEQSFEANPVKYEPRYGGWCAYAMGHEGTKVEVDPETFKIINGQLYLFYNRFFNNTLKTWNQDEPRLLSQADKNWQKILKQ